MHPHFWAVVRIAPTLTFVSGELLPTPWGAIYERGEGSTTAEIFPTFYLQAMGVGWARTFPTLRSFY